MKKVLVVGGTHGNEWTGAYLVTKYAEELKRLFPKLELTFLLANPKAFELNKRFVDEDLNRVFAPIAENLNHQTYEYQRGVELQNSINILSPDWIIDLHTTTSNLGATLILTNEEKLPMKLAASIHHNKTDLKIIYSPDQTNKYLCSQCKNNLMIEIGPVPNGILEPNILLKTKEILEELLTSISENSFTQFNQIEVFEEVKDIYYPQENGEIIAMTHPFIQNRDFVLLKKNDPVFLGFDGRAVFYQEEESLFPIFINEAAYYPSKLAFSLTKKRKRNC